MREEGRSPPGGAGEDEQSTQSALLGKHSIRGSAGANLLKVQGGQSVLASSEFDTDFESPNLAIEDLLSLLPPTGHRCVCCAEIPLPLRGGVFRLSGTVLPIQSHHLLIFNSYDRN
jgi:hypothetical protein